MSDIGENNLPPKKQIKLMAKTLCTSFSDCSSEDLISLLVEMFKKLIEHNDSIPTTLANTTRFHSRTAPGIGIREYVESKSFGPEAEVHCRHAGKERSCMSVGPSMQY